jgi:hypothetical protein
MSSKTKSIYVPVLTKKIAKKNVTYLDWERRFKAYAATKEFLPALQGRANLPNQYADPVTLPVTTDAEKAAKRAVEMNSLAMAFLHQAVETPKGIKLLEKSATTQWPEGIAVEAMTAMRNKFAKIDDLTAVELRQDLSKIEWNKNKDPSKFFEEIASIEIVSAKLTVDQLTESELCSQVFMAAPRRHLAVLQAVKEEKGANLTVDDLEEKMISAWRLEHLGEDDSDIEDDSDDSDDEGTEKALTTQGNGQGGGKKFEGECYKCGKGGHRAFECRSSGYGGRGGRGGGYGGRGGSGGRGKFNGSCHNCGKSGHVKANCWEDEANASKRPSNWRSNKSNEQAMATTNNTEFMCMTVNQMRFPDTLKLLEDPNIMIADTGATCDSTPHAEGIIKTRDARESDGISNASGKNMNAKYVGNMSAVKCDKMGDEVNRVTLPDVRVIPSAKYNLFSLTKRLRAGWKMSGDMHALTIEKNGNKVVFDIVLNTAEGRLYCGYFKRDKTEMSCAAVEDSESNESSKKTARVKKISIDLAHQMLGHPGEDTTRLMCKELGHVLTRGNMKKCEACAVAKAKQKNVPKETKHKRAVAVNGRVYLDISTIKAPRKSKVKVTKPNWRLMVDEMTGLKTSGFYTTKNGMVDPTCELFNKHKVQGRPIKIVRCDNGGENLKLEKVANGEKWKLGIEFEYTGKQTPQRNAVVERGFATIGGRSCTDVSSEYSRRSKI